MVPNRRETQGTNESPSSTDEQKIRERGYEGYTPDRDEQLGDNAPDLVLDVPMLNVDEIDLEVEDLRAHVSLNAQLANLVKINVGIDVYLDKVKLGIKGVEAQALLTVKLNKVLGTLNRALEVLDNNPQLLGGGAQGASRAVEGAGRGVDQTGCQAEGTARSAEDAADQAGGVPGRATDEAGQAADDLLDETVDEEGQIVQRTVDESGNIVESTLDESGDLVDEEVVADLADLRIEEEYVNDRGQMVARALDESGNVVEETLDDEGNVLDVNASGKTGDRKDENEDTNKVRATDAARRKARELGVRLSEVDGTGTRGRILVRDVEKAAR